MINRIRSLISPLAFSFQSSAMINYVGKLADALDTKYPLLAQGAKCRFKILIKHTSVIFLIQLRNYAGCQDPTVLTFIGDLKLRIIDRF